MAPIIGGTSDPGIKTLGNFESWASVIGGILTFSGVSGFLSNTQDFYSKADEDLETWRTFVRQWRKRYKNKPVSVTSLFELAQEKELLSELLQSYHTQEHGQKTSMGQKLSSMVDRNIGGYFLRSKGKNRGGSKLYHLEKHKSRKG